MQGTYSIGDRVGPYEIVSLLGMNFGEVYRAHDPRLGRDVTLKVFFTGLLSKRHLEDLKQGFEREQHLARILDNHPNIQGLH